MVQRKSRKKLNRQGIGQLREIDGNREAAPARFDKLIHERIRLGMVSALAANETLTFSELKKILDTSDGNLSVHARKLEDAGYLICEKTFEGRKPLTFYRITESGRSALAGYIDHMDTLIKSVKEGM
ncbi:MAG: transcriptional regulator [Acidobacteriota bacterium]|nr:transcriptional regulator [Acidobacteriota bacterium]MDH3530820.1 transcriptional regulator [Acidobacteriota bacterium]